MDKLNRQTGIDFENQLKRLSNVVDNRIKFLYKQFPDLVRSEYRYLNLIDTPIEFKIQIIKEIENKLKISRNNHEQLDLFDGENKKK